MKKFVLLIIVVIISTNLFAAKRWVKMGAKILQTDSMYFQKPIQIGDSVNNQVWVDSLTVDDSGDTLLLATSIGLARIPLNPYIGSESQDSTWKSVTIDDAIVFSQFVDSLKGFKCMGASCDSAMIYFGTENGLDSLQIGGVLGGGESDPVFIGSVGAASNIIVETSDHNVGLGEAVLYDRTAGHANCAFGRYSLQHLTEGDFNVAVGTYALQDITTADENVAIGFEALTDNITGSYNVSVGATSMPNLTSGDYNTAVGYHSAVYALGDYNTAVGNISLFYNTGNNNTAIGNGSLTSSSTGNNNLGIGNYAGAFLTTESNRIILNSLNRSNKANDTTDSPIHIVQNATRSLQKIDLNGNVKISDTTYIVNSSNKIYKDGSNNITFTDAITGTKTLAELASGGSSLTAQNIGDSVEIILLDSLKAKIIKIDSTGTLRGDADTIPLQVIITPDGYWKLDFSARYTDPGSGSGDMLASTYDPQSIEDDAFARANHTGTQAASTISDFDTEVSNNTDVSANTSARHSAVTLAGSLDYLTLSTQQITLNQIDLSTDVTGSLDTTDIDNLDEAISDNVDVASNTEHRRLNDTATIFVFGAGVGNSIDTAAFDTDNFYGVFFNSEDTIVVTELRGVLQGTSPSVSIQVSWHATLGSGSATNLNTSAPTITSTTTGDTDTSFDNSDIPPGVWVWATTPTVTTKPTMAIFNLTGYKK